MDDTTSNAPPSQALQPLATRLAAIRAQYAGSDPAMVADVVRAVLDTMTGDTTSRDLSMELTPRESSLLTAVEELGRTIAGTKAEIAALRMDEVSDSHIPFATDELDAIVAHTASATDTILECCETLDGLGPTLSGEPAATLQDVTTRIYEACGFQDITGQRITKIVAALKVIEAKVSHISATFGPARPASDASSVPAQAAPPPAADLLNGPQLPENAMVQSDIDRLLASFD